MVSAGAKIPVAEQRCREIRLLQSAFLLQAANGGFIHARNQHGVRHGRFI